MTPYLAYGAVGFAILFIKCFLYSIEVDFLSKKLRAYIAAEKKFVTYLVENNDSALEHYIDVQPMNLSSLEIQHLFVRACHTKAINSIKVLHSKLLTFNMLPSLVPTDLANEVVLWCLENRVKHQLGDVKHQLGDVEQLTSVLYISTDSALTSLCDEICEHYKNKGALFSDDAELSICFEHDHAVELANALLEHADPNMNLIKSYIEKYGINKDELSENPVLGALFIE